MNKKKITLKIFSNIFWSKRNRRKKSQGIQPHNFMIKKSSLIPLATAAAQLINQSTKSLSCQLSYPTLYDLCCSVNRQFLGSRKQTLETKSRRQIENNDDCEEVNIINLAFGTLDHILTHSLVKLM